MLRRLSALSRTWKVGKMTPISNKYIPCAAAFLAASVILAACLGATRTVAQGAPDYAAIIAAPDRTDADRQTDNRRGPLKLLVFSGVRPGMKCSIWGQGAATAPNSWRAPWRRAELSMRKIRRTFPNGRRRGSTRGYRLRREKIS